MILAFGATLLFMTWLQVKSLIVALYAVFILIVALTVIHNKQDPGKSWAWITVIILIPVAGFILYMLFGRNHRKEKIFNRKGVEDFEIQLETLSARQLYELNHSTFQHRKEIIQNKDIITLLLNSNKSLLTARNKAFSLYTSDVADVVDSANIAHRLTY